MARIESGRVEEVVRIAKERVEELETLLPGMEGDAPLEDAALAGVNPPIEGPLAAILERRFGPRFLRLTPERGVGLVNLCRVPERVGLDRLLAARAALERTHAPTLVVDLGTAATFNLVTPPGIFHGGLIAPGLGLSAAALAGGTALLPPIVRGTGAPPIVGASTEEAIEGGTFWTVVGGVERIVAGVAAELGARPIVLATGGDAERIARATSAVDQVVPDLVLEGIWHVWRERGEG